MNKNFTHLNVQGRAKMVDVTEKEVSKRIAVAEGKIFMSPATLEKIKLMQIGKGDVLAVAQVGGIMGAKKTADLIPLCHPLCLSGMDIDISEHPALETEEFSHLKVTATAKIKGQTGVEMEALTAVSLALLTIYDMCKAVDKEMFINEIRLISKTGGRSDLSNHFQA